MNVVIWARVSSREQREGYSIDAQLRATRERAAKSGWTVVREFVVAESAKRGAERVAFNEMFKWVRTNAKKDKLKTILAHKLDRVCRNMRDAVRLQELEDECGVQLAFIDNQFGPGAAGALSFNVMAAVAQYYSDNLRSEVLKGMDEKVRQGWPTGLAPYGYLNVDDRGEPVQPHPIESKALVRIFDLYSTGKFTSERLIAQLADEGFVYRPSQPRFSRNGLSHLLNNRFYIGELHRNGQVFQGKYRLLIARKTFEACQDILNSRTRRTTTTSQRFSGGIIRCKFCGFAMTSEVIKRKLLHGGVREHIYYRCANNHRGEEHPVVRWREEEVEKAILDEFATIKMPNDEIANWFRQTITAAFDDYGALERQRKEMLTKRRTELAGMQDRLLNGYLAGTIDEAVFKTKQAELKRQQAEVEESLSTVFAHVPEAASRALLFFEFSQNLVEIWRRSNSAVQTEIIECVSLNRHLSDLKLDLVKRKPFDFLAERPFLKIGRGDRI